MLSRPKQSQREAHRGTPVPSPPCSRSLRLKVIVPGVVGLAIKMVVVHGERREMIQDVSGRPWTVLVEGKRGMGLGSGS